MYNSLEYQYLELTFNLRLNITKRKYYIKLYKEYYIYIENFILYNHYL